MALIRYPGSKRKLLDGILEHMPDEYVLPLFLTRNLHYVEPFFGSGSVGFEVMRRMHHDSRVTIADADIGIACLWRAVLQQPRELIAKVERYVPSVESFYEYKERDGTYTDDVDTGFRKLVLHRISMSGFGAMAGGPLGGREQNSDYKVGCRWRDNKIRIQILRLHKLMRSLSRVEVLHADVFDVLHATEEAVQQHDMTFVYLDPPYYEKGDQLYKVKFTPQQHERLAETMIKAPFAWAISYDDHPQIRTLYSWANTHTLEITYCNAVCRGPVRRKNHEILILPQNAGRRLRAVS